MIKSKNPVYWLLKIKNPTHQIDENLGLNPGWFFWFSSLVQKKNLRVCKKKNLREYAIL